MPFSINVLLLSVVHTIAVSSLTSSSSVERWGQFEAVLSGPSTGNPFVDIDLNATFTLSKRTGLADHSTPERSTDALISNTRSSATAVQALVDLDFDSPFNSTTGIRNVGSSSTLYPAAQVLSVISSSDVPAGTAQGRSVDFGTDVTERHVVEIPGDKSPFEGSIAGLEAFTITGWARVVGAGMGAGGDRIVNYCSGGGGIDLVWDAAEGGRLKLAVNEWPDGDHPTSSSGSMPQQSDDAWPRWRFFAVSYDVTSNNTGSENVRWYFGNSRDAASLDTKATGGVYDKGAVQDPRLPLAFGNFGSGYHANDRMLRGRLFAPKIFARALSQDEIVAVQSRSGCAPSCGGSTCGSDGCGGSCGSCSAGRHCLPVQDGKRTGMRKCQMPTTITVDGFYDGDGVYRVRFSPPFEGSWTYTTRSNEAQLDGKSGSFTATAPTNSNHGPVESQGFRLVHADGTPYFSVGTTSYQWTSKSFEMQSQTIETLRQGQGDGPIFNKMRMTVFPKWYVFNHANPVQTGTAYEIKPGSIAANASAWNCVGSSCPSTDGSFDLTRFNVSYWRNYEKLLAQMRDMSPPVIADIIVFHPYDGGHWGFDCMGGRDGATYNTTNDKFYLKYLAARLSSFRNVWWSMANEWSFCACKSYGSKLDDAPAPVWDELFKTLSSADVYGRQMSIHNGNLLYNHSQPWISHVSLQGHEEDTPLLRQRYGKPVVWDEVKYEGDISSGWGALSGEEETDRFWWGASLGVHVGHSETILRPNVDDDLQPLWWAKGGKLIGQSPARIKWFRSLWEQNASRPDFTTLVPSQTYFGDSDHDSFVANVLAAPDGSFQLLHFLRPGRWTVPLAPVGVVKTGASWQVRAVDYWNMDIAVVQTVAADAANVTIDVPEIPGNFEVVLVPSL